MKEYFVRFLYVMLFGYKSENVGTVTFLGKIWGNFPSFPRIGGRGNESKPGGVVVRVLAHDTKRRGFDSWPFHYQVTTLGKLFTHVCLCYQAV